MGYFSNGTEGTMYEERWCARCIHCPTEERGCAVLDAHALHNYDQCRDDQKLLASCLGILIPRSDNGLGNGPCSMFVEAQPKAATFGTFVAMLESLGCDYQTSPFGSDGMGHCVAVGSSLYAFDVEGTLLDIAEQLPLAFGRKP